MESPVKPKIVMDASFWINITYLDLEKYLVKYFNICLVTKVEEEILNNSEHKIYDSKDMEKYLELKNTEVISIINPLNIPKKLLDNLQSNSGELYTIAVGIEEKIIICIDDGNPYNFCFKEGLNPINSIDFIYFLYLKKEISSKQSINYINKLHGRIKSSYIEKVKKSFKGER